MVNLVSSKSTSVPPPVSNPRCYFSSFVAVQLLTRVWLFVIPWTSARQASLSFIVSQSLLKLMSIESVMPSKHLILCHPPLLLPSILPSIMFASNESALLIRWPKYWSFGFSISPSNEYSGLISFRMDWLDLLAVQGTRKSLLQHHSTKATVLWHSDFMAQLSHPNMTKYRRPELVRSLGQEDPLQKGLATHSSILAWRIPWAKEPGGLYPMGSQRVRHGWVINSLNMRTFVSKVMPLLFIVLPSFVIALLPRRKHLLISWLQSPSAVIIQHVSLKNKDSFIFINYYHATQVVTIFVTKYQVSVQTFKLSCQCYVWIFSLSLFEPGSW